MVSNASRAGKADPRFARGAATPTPRTSEPSAAQPKRDDTQLLTDALESYEAMLDIGGGRAFAQAETGAEPLTVGAEIDSTRALIRSLRGFLASRGADALFSGPAQAGMLGLARAAIECHLEQLQASAEMLLACAVVARPDEKWGETPLAFVELRPESQPESPEAASALAEALIAHCRQHLARFKCPREVRFEVVPKTSTGKIQKHVLRAKVGSAGAIG